MWATTKRVAGLLGASAFGVAIVATLFAGLTGMIAGGGDALTHIEAHEIRFEFVPPQERLETKRDLKPERDPVDLPSTPDLVDPGPCFDCAVSLAPRPVINTIPFERAERIQTLGGGSGVDTDPQPIVRIPPEYPVNGRGDGFVLVQFDISPAGTVLNLRVVDASPRGMFEKSALRAIERWRYRPAVFEGRAVERRGIQVRLRFELERA